MERNHVSSGAGNRKTTNLQDTFYESTPVFSKLVYRSKPCHKVACVLPQREFLPAVAFGYLLIDKQALNMFGP